jgi:hypothetical protein
MGPDDRRDPTCPGRAFPTHPGVTMTVEPDRPNRVHEPRHRVGLRLHHRRRGNSTLRTGTSIAIAGGLIVAAGFSLMAFRTTQAHDAARAAARARVAADEHQQYERRQAARARLKATQLSAKLHAHQVARLNQIQATQQAATQQAATASSAAAVAAANAAAAQANATAAAGAATAAPSSPSSGTGTDSSSGAVPSTPVAVAGGS